jgi:predicted DCC family thiol-disulfide oxidoreductase YuxK
VATRAAGEHLLLYDGVCGLCNRVVQFVLPRDGRRLFDFASLQSETGRTWLARTGHHPNALDTVIVVANYRAASATAYTKADAALFVADALGWPWRSAFFLRLVPRPFRNALYEVIARRRYRLFGRYDGCLLPRADQRDRFLDV